MLFGGSSWSEVPISSLTFPSFNGDEFHFGFIIDTELGLTETIDQVLSSNKIVDTVFRLTENSILLISFL